MSNNKNKITQAKSITSLNYQQELFCQFFVKDMDCYANSTKAYAKAYKKDLSNPKENKTCQSNAYKLLRKTEILERIRDL